MKKQGPPPSLEKLNPATKRKANQKEHSQRDDLQQVPIIKEKSSERVTKRVKVSVVVPPRPEYDASDGLSDDSSGIKSSQENTSEITTNGKTEPQDVSTDLSDSSEASVFDSDDDQPRIARFSEDEDESDAEEKLTAANIEGLSRKLDQERAELDIEAQQELEDAALDTNIASEDGQLNTNTDGLAPDLQLLRTRIMDTIRILGNFRKLSEKDKFRADYTSQLLSDICLYYGYTSFLAEKLLSLFSPQEAFAFFEANESPRPVVLRTNTLRTNRRSLASALINRGVVLEPVGKWSKVGLQVFDTAVPLGATPEYLAGHYIVQAASSFLPVMALAPEPDERVLDMAAAPGGKTTHISALMRNSGEVFANDASKQRSKGLIGNIHRLGCKNTIVTNLDAKEAFPKLLGGFDRVLLDAPCSGTGVIGKDPSVKTSKTEKDFLTLPHTQKQLLLAAIDSVDHNSKTGGIIVYSTCSVTVEENEQVVQYALKKRPNVTIVDPGLGTFGSEGFKNYMNKHFDSTMVLTRRYYPHRENVDGFFVCKLKKTGPTPTASQSNSQASVSKPDRDAEAETDAVSQPIHIFQPDSDVHAPIDEFGPFDSEEDREVLQKAERKRLRKKGLNPKLALRTESRKP